MSNDRDRAAELEKNALAEAAQARQQAGQARREADDNLRRFLDGLSRSGQLDESDEDVRAMRRRLQERAERARSGTRRKLASNG